MSEVILTYSGERVQIESDGRALGELPAHSPLLIPAGQMADDHPDLAEMVWRAALLVEAGDVEVIEGPFNVFDRSRNATGRVGRNGRHHLIRAVPGHEALAYEEYVVEVCDCSLFGAGEMLGVMHCEHTLALRLARRVRFEAEELAGLSGFEDCQVGRWATNLIRRRPDLEHQARRALAIIFSDLVEAKTADLMALRPQKISVYDPLIFARFYVAGDGRRWSCTCAAGPDCAHVMATRWMQRIAGSTPVGLVNQPETTRRRRLVRSMSV